MHNLGTSTISPSRIIIPAESTGRDTHSHTAVLADSHTDLLPGHGTPSERRMGPADILLRTGLQIEKRMSRKRLVLRTITLLHTIVQSIELSRVGLTGKSHAGSKQKSGSGNNIFSNHFHNCFPLISSS